jgi:CheY-like chemotaxis protein
MMARVLIVQGHARSRADTAATLRAEGHDVLEAGSADNGVRMAHEQGPEVILLDPMLPDRSGYEPYASLQRDPATLAIPVLFLPGELPPVTAEAGELPVGGLDIVTRLGLALRTKSLNDELRLADVSLRSAVLTDSLTGLARLGMGPVSVILADMDGFAEVNERCGYAVGDRLLQAFAGLLHESRGRGIPSAPARHQARRRLVRRRTGPPPHRRHRRRPRPRRPHPHRLLRRRREPPPPPTPGVTSWTAPKPPSSGPNEPAATAARSRSVTPCGSWGWTWPGVGGGLRGWPCSTRAGGWSARGGRPATRTSRGSWPPTTGVGRSWRWTRRWWWGTRPGPGGGVRRSFSAATGGPGPGRIRPTWGCSGGGCGRWSWCGGRSGRT